MILIIHIVAALAGIATSTISYFKPSKTIFRATSGLVITTVATGTYLTIQNPAHLLKTCLSGLIYIAIVVSISAFAWRHATKHQNI